MRMAHPVFVCSLYAVVSGEAGTSSGCAFFLREYIMNNMASQQPMRRNAAKPGLPRRSNAKTGQGRERMRGQFAGYIPANRAEKFREAATEMSDSSRRLRELLR